MMVVCLVLAALQQPAPPPTKLPPLPAALSDTSPFRRLALPTPTLLREGSGRPGPRYWQQRADYTISVALDTAAHKIAGRETIRYTNNSPDTLRYLWLQLDQNLFRDDSRGAVLTPPDARFAARGFQGGFVLDGVRAVRRTGNRPARSVSIATTINGTMMRVDLDQPLPPGGGVVSLDIGFSFQVPEHGADRMGREQFPEGWLYEIAQWYPRMAVYDDVRGWNTEQYLGQGEFYLEYGDIDFAITVPRGFVVAGTGTLQNPLDVLTPTQRARLARALRSDSTVAIIAKGEVGKASSRPAGAGRTLTWRFSAKNVRDVAWAAAPNFIWDASGWNGILMQSFYPPVADSIWRESTRMVRHSIKHYSEKWFSYPYPTAINVNGPVGGMEYPMIVFCANRTSREGLFGVTTHELGHEWFPMIVGNNERLYAWMDEGFNTFIDLANAALYFKGDAYGDSIEAHPLHLYRDHATPGVEQPLINRPVEVHDLFWGGYQKPALMMQLLRYQVLGKDRFDGAFREYLRTWAFKHPTPADFFRLMRDHSGQELDWFWRAWVYTTARLDQAVDSVVTRDGATEVHLSNRGTMVMPADLLVTLTDASGKVQLRTVALPVDMWNLGSRFVYRLRGGGTVRKVQLDPDEALPDIDRRNNTWQQ